MAEVMLILFAIALSGFFGWCLGVRRERGRQLRLEEIREMARQVTRKKGGITLHHVRLRR